MDLALYKRPLMVSALLIVAVTAGGWFSDMMVAIMVSMLVILWQILRLLYYAVRWNKTGLALSSMRFLMWMAAAVAAGATVGHYSDQARAQGNTLVAALQAHHAREARYPEKLEALAPRDIAAIPVIAMSPVRDGSFRYHSNGKTFFLIYVTGFRMGASYDSEAAQWVALD
jgi:hypothetical protein